MTDKSWIKLYRKSQQNPLYFKEKFTRWHAWQDLLLIANHKPGFVIKNGQIIEIKRGQVGHSILDLSLRWKWSRNKVKNFLKLLENEQQILVETRQRVTTIITITNYNNYQAKEQENIEVKGQRKDNGRTTEGQRKDINKNGKNGKNKTYSQNSDEFRLSLLLFSLIIDRRNSFKKPNLQSWANHINLMIRIDKRDVGEIENIIQWCQKDLFWQNNILSTQKLRKQFDRLALQVNTQEQGEQESKYMGYTCRHCGEEKDFMKGDRICEKCRDKGLT